MSVPTGFGNYPAGVTDNDPHFCRHDGECDIMDEQDIEDQNDAHWDHQQQLEQEMLEEDPGYADWLIAVASSHSIQLGD